MSICFYSKVFTGFFFFLEDEWVMIYLFTVVNYITCTKQSFYHLSLPTLILTLFYIYLFTYLCDTGKHSITKPNLCPLKSTQRWLYYSHKGYPSSIPEGGGEADTEEAPGAELQFLFGRWMWKAQDAVKSHTQRVACCVVCSTVLSAYR